MDWLKSLAPTLSTLLTGTPFAGVAASIIADKLGLSDGAVEAVQGALNGNSLTSDQIASLKIAENDMIKFLSDNNIKLEDIAAKDRASARGMLSATGSTMPAVLTIMITIGFFGALGWMMYDHSAIDSPPMMIMLGSLGTAWSGACAFWLGTTHASGQKTEMLAQAQPIK